MISPRRLALGALLLVPLVGIPAAAYAGAGHHCGGSSPKDAIELREHLSWGAGRMLDRVDATDEQAAQVDPVLDRVAPELFALKVEHQALREDARAALTAPTVDRAQVEEIRKDAVALFDQASVTVVGAVVDIAGVLTQEQRQELAESMERWHR